MSLPLKQRWQDEEIPLPGTSFVSPLRCLETQRPESMCVTGVVHGDPWTLVAGSIFRGTFLMIPLPFVHPFSSLLVGLCLLTPTRKCRVEFNQGGKTCIREVFKLIYADSRFNWGDWPTILGGKIGKAEQKHI